MTLYRWTDGRYGVGKRISFSDSLRIIEQINDGSLEKVPTYTFKYFNFEVPESVDGISEDVLYPERGWNSKVEYDETLSSLAL